MLEAVAGAAAEQPHVWVLRMRRRYEMRVRGQLVGARAVALERGVAKRREAIGEVASNDGFGRAAQVAEVVRVDRLALGVASGLEAVAVEGAVTIERAVVVDPARGGCPFVASLEEDHLLEGRAD